MLSFAIQIYFSPVPHLFLAVVSVSMSNFLINDPDKLLLCRQVTKKGKENTHFISLACPLPYQSKGTLSR